MRFATVVMLLVLGGCKPSSQGAFGGGADDQQTLLASTVALLNATTFFGVVEVTGADQCPFVAGDGRPGRPPDDAFYCPNGPDYSRLQITSTQPLLGSLGASSLICHVDLEGPKWGGIKAFFGDETPKVLVMLRAFAPTSSLHGKATPDFCGVPDSEPVAHFDSPDEDHMYIVHDGKVMWIGWVVEEYSTGAAGLRQRLLEKRDAWHDLHEFDEAVAGSRAAVPDRPQQIADVSGPTVEVINAWEAEYAPDGRWVYRTPVLACAWTPPP